jgi:hypothetical protein
VLRATDYQTVMDTTLSAQSRLDAFRTRVDWFRGFVGNDDSDIAQMITEFSKLGIVEERDGPHDLPGIPSRLWVESQPALPDPDTRGMVATAVTVAEPAQFSGRTLRQIGRFGAPPE